MRKNLIFAVLIMALSALSLASCSKETTSPEVVLSEEVLGPCLVRITATLPKDNTVTDDFLKITLKPTYSFATNKEKDGKMQILLTDLTPDQLYTYTALYIKDGVYYNLPERSFKTPDLSKDPVDMGVSVQWASCNLGANNSYELGSSYTWEEARNCTTDAGWRLPTRAEYEELVEQCFWGWIQYHSVYGLTATSISTNNTIFFPASSVNPGIPSGYYWTSSPADNEEVYVFQSVNGMIMLSMDASEGLRAIPNGHGLHSIPFNDKAFLRPVH